MHIFIFHKIFFTILFIWKVRRSTFIPLLQLLAACKKVWSSLELLAELAPKTAGELREACALLETSGIVRLIHSRSAPLKVLYSTNCWFTFWIRKLQVGTGVWIQSFEELIYRIQYALFSLNHNFIFLLLSRCALRLTLGTYASFFWNATTVTCTLIKRFFTLFSINLISFNWFLIHYVHFYNLFFHLRSIHT